MVKRKGTLEDVEMNQFGDIYRGKRVLITGHTGFKGSWLSLWLTQLGAEVVGISLKPETQPNHWSLLGLESKIQHHELDIRNYTDIIKIFKATQPEVIFHLAAQPLVRRSYRYPLDTWSTNVMGTANILEACRQTQSVHTILVVTSDKCYENQEWIWGYRETDRLGGHDPYSSSKAGSELVATSYRSAFFNTDAAPLLATARAGNVIGGGDWSEDRLIPDLIRAISAQQSLEVRFPNATRPWQHVLESLCGYLMLGQKIIEGDRKFEGAWNFGPEQSANCNVAAILNKLHTHWSEIQWHQTAEEHPYEANLLHLDSSKARSQLGWQPLWDLNTTLEKTIKWYQAYTTSELVISNEQLVEYVESAKKAGSEWIAT